MKVLFCLILGISLVAASPLSAIWRRLTTWEEPDVCAVDSRRRIHCPGAHLGITEQACQELGCCYDTSVWNKPWCYPNATASIYEECDVNPATRLLCPGAYPGILHGACADLGCCYDDSLIGIPWCFPKKQDGYYEKCQLLRSERKSCPGAYLGITATACAALDCCYDDSPGLSIQGVPWCYAYDNGY